MDVQKISAGVQEYE